MQEMQQRQFQSLGCDPWRRAWQPTLVFLLGKSQGQRSLEGYSPWGHKSDMTEVAEHSIHTHTHTQTHISMPTPYRVCAISSLRGRVYLCQVRELYSRANPTFRGQMHVWGDAMRCPEIPSRKSAGRWEAGEQP